MSTVPEAFTSKSPDESSPESSGIAGWQRELAQAVRTVDELLRRVGLNPAGLPLNHVAEQFGLEFADSEMLQRFSVLVPENFISRMTHADPHDPLLRQVLPLAAESQTNPGFTADAVGDLDARRAPGVLQKYAGRVLLIAASACAIHCRYCFRREYPYAVEPRRLDDWQPALEMISRDSSISEVIFSGGDPLMLSDSRLRVLCQAIDSIPHIERIRFHTRLPIVLPSRITTELISLLIELRSQPILVVHANHANEIVGDCARVLRSLVRQGFPVLNQTVLLSGINDSVDSLESLCRKLINVGVMPYYLHQLDRVSGTTHFEVDRLRGVELIRQLAARLPGYAVPRYVEEISGEPNKSAISHLEMLY
jgi:EF-P beta-lysylation protein EpmB